MRRSVNGEDAVERRASHFLLTPASRASPSRARTRACGTLVRIVERDLFRPPSAYRRWLLYGVLLTGVLFVARATLEAAGRPRPLRQVRLADCIQGGKASCQGEDVQVEGAYVPDSLGATPECPRRLELQAPGGKPGGTLAVCVEAALVPAPVFPDNCGDVRMHHVVANGYYSLKATGKLKGAVFHAKQLFGGDCDAKYYAWKYGPSALEAR